MESNNLQGPEYPGLGYTLMPWKYTIEYQSSQSIALRFTTQKFIPERNTPGNQLTSVEAAGEKEVPHGRNMVLVPYFEIEFIFR